MLRDYILKNSKTYRKLAENFVDYAEIISQKYGTQEIKSADLKHPIEFLPPGFLSFEEMAELGWTKPVDISVKEAGFWSELWNLSKGAKKIGRAFEESAGRFAKTTKGLDFIGSTTESGGRAVLKGMAVGTTLGVGGLAASKLLGVHPSTTGTAIGIGGAAVLGGLIGGERSARGLEKDWSMLGYRNTRGAARRMVAREFWTNLLGRPAAAAAKTREIEDLVGRKVTTAAPHVFARDVREALKGREHFERYIRNLHGAVSPEAVRGYWLSLVNPAAVSNPDRYLQILERHATRAFEQTTKKTPINVIRKLSREIKMPKGARRELEVSGFREILNPRIEGKAVRTGTHASIFERMMGFRGRPRPSEALMTQIEEEPQEQINRKSLTSLITPERVGLLGAGAFAGKAIWGKKSKEPKLVISTY